MKPLLLCTIALFLSACASMNKNECTHADWLAVGYKHGARGQNAEVFERYQKDCAKHQIRADFTTFKQGHERGLGDYCNFETGLSLGKQGDVFNTQCPKQRYPQFTEGYFSGIDRYCSRETGYHLGIKGNDIKGHANQAVCDDRKYPDFYQGNAEGYARYLVTQDISRLENELENIDVALSSEHDAIDQDEALIVSDTSTSEMRAQALLDIEDHQNAIRTLNKQYSDVKRSLRLLVKQLQSMP